VRQAGDSLVRNFGSLLPMIKLSSETRKSRKLGKELLTQILLENKLEIMVV